MVLFCHSEATRLQVMIMIYEYMCRRYVSFVSSRNNFGYLFLFSSMVPGRSGTMTIIRGLCSELNTDSVTSRSLVLIRCPFVLRLSLFHCTGFSSSLSFHPSIYSFFLPSSLSFIPLQITTSTSIKKRD